ncbi:MAG: hypothetical protein COA74_09385 [Gammaproteobacteria bacterium]|nr:MAG: hypothetical protein COA74_09385 [Gammaproteobacteria bacterium]
MAILHSLQHSCDDQTWFKLCLASLEVGDGIILLEDAVSISCHLPSLKRLNTLAKSLTIYVMDVDLEARGLSAQFKELTSQSSYQETTLNSRLSSSLKYELINYQEFVELTLQYDKLVNWA